MYKKGAGNDKQGKDVGNRTLCPYRNFSQALNDLYQPVSTTESKVTATTCIDLYQPVSTTEIETTATTCIDLYQPVSTTESKATATATTCINSFFW